MQSERILDETTSDLILKWTQRDFLVYKSKDQSYHRMIQASIARYARRCRRLGVRHSQDSTQDKHFTNRLNYLTRRQKLLNEYVSDYSENGRYTAIINGLCMNPYQMHRGIILHDSVGRIIPTPENQSLIASEYSAVQIARTTQQCLVVSYLFKLRADGYKQELKLIIDCINGFNDLILPHDKIKAKQTRYTYFEDFDTQLQRFVISNSLLLLTEQVSELYPWAPLPSTILAWASDLKHNGYLGFSLDMRGHRKRIIFLEDNNLVVPLKMYMRNAQILSVDGCRKKGNI